MYIGMEWQIEATCQKDSEGRGTQKGVIEIVGEALGFEKAEGLITTTAAYHRFPHRASTVPFLQNDHPVGRSVFHTTHNGMKNERSNNAKPSEIFRVWKVSEVLMCNFVASCVHSARPVLRVFS